MYLGKIFGYEFEKIDHNYRSQIFLDDFSKGLFQSDEYFYLELPYGNGVSVLFGYNTKRVKEHPKFLLYKGFSTNIFNKCTKGQPMDLISDIFFAR